MRVLFISGLWLSVVLVWGGCGGGQSLATANNSNGNGNANANSNANNNANDNGNVNSNGNTNTGAECGDDVLEGLEVCDGTNLGGETCTSQGFVGGTLACTLDCTLDTTGCESGACPNGQIDAGEDCDGTNLGGETCAGLGFDSGALACAGDCFFDVDGCVGGSCGNGSIESPEECDGSDLGGLDCTDFGYSGGALDCTSGCLYATTNCTGTPSCTAAGGAVACGSGVTGDTSAPPAVASITSWAGAGCSTWTYTGPEIIYVVNSGSTAEQITVDLTGLGADLDLIVMKDAGLGCDPGLSCVGNSTSGGPTDESVTFLSVANTDYFVVIDGYEGAMGPYNLDITCSQATRMIYEWFPINTNDTWDLEGTTVTFSPNTGAAMGYTYAVATGVTGFPTPIILPTGGLAFGGSDDTAEVAFAAGRTFTFFDVTYTSMWVNTNGSITFGAGDPDPEESDVSFAGGPPRISGEWDNINPVAVGPSTVSVLPYNDRIVVTWDYAADNFTGQGDHAIQIELFWSGQIAVTNLVNGGNDGLLGITEGGGQPLSEVNFVP